MEYGVLQDRPSLSPVVGIVRSRTVQEGTGKQKIKIAIRKSTCIWGPLLNLPALFPLKGHSPGFGHEKKAENNLPRFFGPAQEIRTHGEMVNNKKQIH